MNICGLLEGDCCCDRLCEIQMRGIREAAGLHTKDTSRGATNLARTLPLSVIL